MFDRKFVILVLLLSSTFQICAQELLSEISKVSRQTNTLKNILVEIEEKHQVFFAYNTTIISQVNEVIIPNKTLKLNELLQLILFRNEIGFEVNGDKIVLYSTKKDLIQISGTVRDRKTHESLASASIIYNNGEEISYCNQDGFFSITVERTDSVTLIINYFPYNMESFKLTADKSHHILELNKEVELPKIIVTETRKQDFNSPGYNPDANGEKITMEEVENSSGVFGSADVMHALKRDPSISSGFEGQNGFVVRGAGTDQNLVLFDGIPMYEISHLGGVSSIFLPESLKDIEFNNSGIPARYGGRLSSVVNIRSKDGSQNEYYRNLSIGIDGIGLHLNGPIAVEKTSFSFSGRTSWLSNLSKPFAKKFLKLEDYDLNFQDVHGKITHWFSPSNSLSLSAYKGSDLISLRRNRSDIVINDSFYENIYDFNSVTWGNDLLSANWKMAIGNKVFMNMRLGSHTYSNRSNGNSEYYKLEGGQRELSRYVQNSSSSINDKIVSLDFDIYTQNAGSIKAGAGFQDHKYRPSLTKSLWNQNTQDTTLTRDLAAKEYFLYLEDRFTLLNKLNVHLGLRYNLFNTTGVSYSNLQPRLSISYVANKNLLSFGFSRMNQYTHLLVNPGTGLPSDLWVPSTAEIQPQELDELSIKYVLNTKDKTQISFAIYGRQFKKQIDYINTEDYFFDLLITDIVTVLPPSNINWEDNISIGEGTSRGIEIGLHKKFDRMEFNLTYAYSKSERTFPLINNGEKFPFRFDRRNDFNFYSFFNFNKKSSLHVQYIIGSGHAYTLAIDKFPGPNEQIIIDSDKRNNTRFPIYHHLDLNYRYTKDYFDGKLEARFGVYNVYNQFNPFYMYIIENDRSNSDEIPFIPKKVSLFPILPQISLSFIW